MVKELSNDAQLAEVLSKGFPLVVIHFAAPWAPQCKQIDDVLTALEPEFSEIPVLKIDAEEIVTASMKYNIVAVPTIVFLEGENVADRVDGANVSHLVSVFRTLAAKAISTVGAARLVAPAVPKGELTPALRQRIEILVGSAAVMLFMKGEPEVPRCGFSRTIVGILNDAGVKFSTFDILTDENVRQGLKLMFNWPTFPQVYVKGKLVGGLDVVKELVEEGEFLPMVPKDAGGSA